MFYSNANHNMNHTHNLNQTPHLTQTDGEHNLRFAGPDLLDYTMIFEISGGIYDGERLKIERISSSLRLLRFARNDNKLRMLSF